MNRRAKHRVNRRAVLKVQSDKTRPTTYLKCLHFRCNRGTKNSKATVAVKRNAVVFEPGLTNREFSELESLFDFRFPPDLRWFLGSGVPLGARFPNWKNPGQSLRDQIERPLDGICFDISNDVFWWPDWGTKPESNDEAIAVAKKHFAKFPTLIPVFGHSFLPCEPLEPENPIFSVHQADVIHRGANLAEYLMWLYHDENGEDLEQQYPVFSEEYKHIEFWTELTRQNSM